MDYTQLRKTLENLRLWMVKEGYCEGYIKHYKSVTNQLLKFMEKREIPEYQIDVGHLFLKEKYGMDTEMLLHAKSKERLRTLQMLAEFQLHGVPLKKVHSRTYEIPTPFQQATDEFLAEKRFQGIIQRNMSTLSLYLERFFDFITSHGVKQISEITGQHIHSFLRYISGFSEATKSNTMRTVRHFMVLCYQKGYHPMDLSSYAPNIRCEHRSTLPSVYTPKEVSKILSSIDRSNPVGKRNYALILLITRLGMRCGDVCNLKFSDIDWEQNKLHYTQHKTGVAQTLPLFEDVGMAIIDYLKYGRPKSDSSSIFLQHRAPIIPCNSSGVYSLVSRHITKMDFPNTNRKRGPHALRHSLASRLLEGNIPLPVISAILGHANTETTSAYLAIDIDKLRLCALEV